MPGFKIAKKRKLRRIKDRAFDVKNRETFLEAIKRRLKGLKG